jgi:hypothetical protein
MKLNRKEDELQDMIAFQRKLLAHIKQFGPLSKGAKDSTTGEMLTAGEFYDRYTMTLHVMLELEEKFKSG